MRKAILPATIAVGLGVLFTAIATFEPFTGEEGGAPDQAATYGILLLIVVVAAAVVFGLIVPRARNQARTALILAVVAVVTLVAFWTALPMVLGVGALTLARESQAGGRRSTPSLVALVIAALAMIADAVACVTG